MNSQSSQKSTTSYSIILVVAGAHLINDLIQFLVPALYPLFKDNSDLSYFQLGMITLAQQITACVLQPVMGLYGDVRPKPLTLAVSLVIVALGVLLLATASSFALLLVAAAVLGVGSALFHPEASRVSRMASGGKLGFAQSTFQVGGNTGTALGPLAVVLLVLPLGQSSIVWFGLLAALGVIMLVWAARWYAEHQRMVTAMGPTVKIETEILSSAFSAIVVYAQELMPQNVGMVAGFVFGVAFGIGAFGAAALGALADHIGIQQVFSYFSLLLMLGFLTVFLPKAKQLASDSSPETDIETPQLGRV